MPQRDRIRRIDPASALLGGLVALVIVGTVPAMAAEIGDALALGESNRINGRTILRGNGAANFTILSEARPNSGGTALDLRVREGNAPFKVNSSVLVENLNADHIDGRDAAEFAEQSEVAELSARLDALETLLAGVLRAGDDLSFPGNVALGGGLDVGGPIAVRGPVAAGSDIAVGGSLDVGRDATVRGLGAVAGNLQVGGALAVDGPAAFGSDLAMGGTLEVGVVASIARDVVLGGNLEVDGALAVDGPAAFGSDLAMGGTLEVGRDASVAGEVQFGGSLFVGGGVTATTNVCAGRTPVCLL